MGLQLPQWVSMEQFQPFLFKVVTLAKGATLAITKNQVTSLLSHFKGIYMAIRVNFFYNIIAWSHLEIKGYATEKELKRDIE